METLEFESKKEKGRKTGVMAIVEGIRFWAREDAANEDRNLIDLSMLRPMNRLGWGGAHVREIGRGNGVSEAGF